MQNEIHVDASGHETIAASTELRFRGKRSTTIEPRILQQAFTVTRYDASGRVISERIEWRDVPLHLED